MTAQVAGLNNPTLTAQLRELRNTIWQLRNGELAAAIQREDTSYSQVLGVALPALRAVAQEYAPNQPLARLLIALPQREPLLLAQLVGDATQFTPDDLARWLPSFRHPEVRNAACAYLLSASPLAVQFSRELVRANDPIRRATGVLLLAHALRRGNRQTWPTTPDPMPIDYFEKQFLPLTQLAGLVDVQGLLQPMLFLARQLALSPKLRHVALSLANSLVDQPDTTASGTPHNLLYEELAQGLEESKLGAQSL